MNINLIKTSLGLGAVASVLAFSGAARAVSCTDYDAAKPHLYVAGSTAIKPFIQVLSTALAADEVVIYVSQGSCVGVSDALHGDLLPTGADLGIIGPTDTCTVPADTKADVGVSDVFATSCDGVDAVPAGVGEFQGPIQIMNFIVPKGADAGIQSISAEAAYLTFGFDPSTTNADTGKSYADGTPWTSRDDIWIRGPGSGTQSMLAAAIKVLPGSWALNNYTDGALIKHAVANGSTEILTRVGGATNLDSTIGILASTDLDDNRDKVRGLAFQGYDQSCGYWPDSTSGAKDKANIRNGKYQVWGALHMYAAVDDAGKPTVDGVADFVDYVNGSKAVAGDDGLAVVKLEVKKNLVPKCAMQVSRDTEVGPLQSVNPTCGCFYESQRLHGGAEFTGCVACDDATPCADHSLTCSYGFCEAI